MTEEKRQLTVLVCGGRYYSDVITFERTMNLLYAYSPIKNLHIIHGADAAGADSIVRNWCDRNGISMAVYLPDWENFGKAAGPMRNQQMIDEGKPDLVVAFDGKKGTADMVKRAKAAGIPVLKIA